MSTILKYILACCLFLSSFNGISKDILIDAGFSSTEIYNTLTCSKQIVGKDLKFDLTMKNISGKEQQLLSTQRLTRLRYSTIEIQ